MTTAPARRLLFVDDAPDNHELLRWQLKGSNFELYHAHSVAEARRWLSAFGAPAVIVSDIGMPDEDGVALIRWLRSCPEYESVPALATTGYVDEPAVRHFIEAGFSAHLPRPFIKAQLLAALELLYP
jgi:CheY-like chemotaxis protein